MANGTIATLIVKLGADTADIKKGVDRATRDLDGLAKTTERIDKAVGGSFANMARSAASVAAGMVTAELALGAISKASDLAVGAVKAVGSVFTDAVRQTITLGDSLFGLSQKTGVSVESLSALRFVAGQTNTSLDTLTNAIFKMQTSLGKGGEATASSISKLGLSLRDLRASDPADAFTKILTRLGEIPNATQRAAIGAQVFGRQFKEIANLTQEDLTGLVEKAKQLGVVMSTETAVAADRFKDSLATLQARAEGFAITIGNALLPGLIAFVESVSSAFDQVLAQSGLTLGGLQSIIDDVVVGVGQAAAKLIQIIANMVDAVTEFVTGGFIKTLAILEIFQQIAENAALAGRAIDLAFNFGGLQSKFDDLQISLARVRKFMLDAGEGALDAGGKLRTLAQATSDIAGKVGASFKDTFARVKVEIAKAADEMRARLRKGGEGAEDMVSDIVKAFQKLQDKVRGVDIVKQARAWELALQDPMNVAFTFADKALSTELRDALDAVVVKFGDLETAGVGSLEAIHDAVRRRLTPAITEGLGSLKQLPGQIITQFDLLRQSLVRSFDFKVINGEIVEALPLKTLPGQAIPVGKGLAAVITHPIRDAFANIGRELPDLIFGAIRSGQSVIGTVAQASAGQFMKVFNDAIARIAKTPGGGKLSIGERLAGLTGVGLASLANSIALGSQTSSLLGGALAGAGTGAALGFNPALSGPTLGASILVGAGVGLFGGLLGAIKGKKQERQAVEASKAQFEAQFGGFEKLRQLAEKAGLSIDRVFNAKSPEQFNNAVKLVNQQLAAYNKHLEGLQTALEGVNRRALVFAGNFSDLITRRDELLQSGAGGAELDSLNAKIAEVAQRTQPEFERLGLIVRDVFAGIVKESGDAFGAIQSLAPAFQVLKDGVDKFGLTSTAAIDELLKSFNLISDETLGPFLQNIQASGQVLKGLFDAKALSPEGFQAIAADIGQSFQEIINRGGDITRALALNQPILQTLFEAQQRFGLVTDQTTQSILNQAKEQGLVGEHMKNVNEKILDVLLAIADVFGAKIPEALKNTAAATGAVGDAFFEISDGAKSAFGSVTDNAFLAAETVEDIFRRIKVPPVTIPVELDTEGLPIPDPNRFRAFEIPELASVGIVRRPTLAIVGEAGPEAVVPLGGSGSTGFASSTSVTFERGAFEGIVVDNDDRVEQLANRIFTLVRRGGRTRTAAINAGLVSS